MATVVLLKLSRQQVNCINILLQIVSFMNTLYASGAVVMQSVTECGNMSFCTKVFAAEIIMAAG